MDDKKVVGIDYAKEYEILNYRIKELIEENEKYKKALLNICLKV